MTQKITSKKTTLTFYKIKYKEIPELNKSKIMDDYDIILSEELPTTLQIPINVAFLSFASFIAANVSAVSPD